MSSNNTKNLLSPKQREDFFKTLKARFEKNAKRHKGVDWAKVQARLEANAEKVWSLSEMESTGGEPDVVGHDLKTANIFFTIAPQKAPKIAEVFVTMAKRWNPEKRTNPPIAPSGWRLRWVLSC